MQIKQYPWESDTYQYITYVSMYVIAEKFIAYIANSATLDRAVMHYVQLIYFKYQVFETFIYNNNIIM